MTYSQALEYFQRLQLSGINLGLGRVKKILKKFNNPESGLSVIHIAGTNGKGSVAKFIASILQSAGYRVGLYTSPHLKDIRERIQINEKYISRKDFTRLVEQVKSFNYEGKDSLTYFEFLTIIAFLYFSQKEVNFGVLETGMGGRLDATNVIKNPLVSVITNIDYDHQQFLGRDLRAIAREKAGIVKKNSLVLTGEKRKMLLNLLQKVCQQKRTKIFQLRKDIYFSRTDGGFNYRGIFRNFDNLHIRMKGAHQFENASLAIGAVEALKFHKIEISGKAIRRGLEKAEWPGRLEERYLTVGRKRVRIILDGAHNLAGMRCLRRYLEENNLKDIIFILGFLKDKLITKMLRIISPIAGKVILTMPVSPRAATVERVSKKAKLCLGRTEILLSPRIEEVVEIARHNLGRGNVVCITGSLYTVAGAMEVINDL